MPLKILVVDDSRLSRMMSSHMLQILRPEAQIFEAEDGASALSLLHSSPTDIAIIDVNMPGLSGIDLVQIIQEKWPTMRLALLTANVQEGMRQRAEQLHVHFFCKPITEPLIASILATLAPV